MAPRLLGDRPRHDARGLATALQLLQGRRCVRRANNDVGLRSGRDGLGHLFGDVAPDGHHAPERTERVGLERPPVGGDEIAGHGGAARVGVLDDGHRDLAGPGVSGQLVDQPPRRVAVEDVQVGQRAARVLDHAVPPAGRPRLAVARASLVRVLSVAQQLGAFEREVQGRREDLGQLGLLDVGSGGAREVPDGCGPAGVEPGDDGRVVGGSVGERGPGEPATGRRRERAGDPQLLEHGRVVGRRGDDADVLVVLGRRPHHGRAPDVDELDGGVGGERIEIRHHQVDGIDPEGRQVVEMLGLGAVGEDPAVDLGVEGLDPPTEHLGRAGHLCHLDVGDVGLAQRGRRVAAGDQLPAQFREALGQLDQALLVVDGQQRPHDVISCTAPRLSGWMPRPASSSASAQATVAG